jgi:hypothetical protein
MLTGFRRLGGHRSRAGNARVFDIALDAAD